jgi:hypothetical protein
VSAAQLWVNSIPKRWSRNGALFVLAVGVLDASPVVIFNWPRAWLLHNWLWNFPLAIAFAALVFGVLGLWARWSLNFRRSPDWQDIRRSIVPKFVSGAVLVASALMLYNYVDELSHAVVTGETIEECDSNGKDCGGQEFSTWMDNAVGTSCGVIFVAAIFGLIVSLVSMGGLRKAIAADPIIQPESE